MANRAPIITLTTDFGYKDHYVAAMKAVILGINPDARIIDISHGVPPQDIMAGAWVLRNSAYLFPEGTIHVAVIDPGVGSDRRPVLVCMNGHLFVGPDNGQFSLIDGAETADVYELTNRSLWRDPQSNTFHGRDIFSPVAAHISLGIPPAEAGELSSGLLTYRWARAISDEKGIQGWVVHIDAYGNLITNIPGDLIHADYRDNIKIYVGTFILNRVSRTFTDVSPGEPAIITGSTGMLEVIINKGNAEEMLSVQKGAPVSVIYQK
jgi:S-adenosyl-L-methionine hydrolase (adenosine-forming)